MHLHDEDLELYLLGQLTEPRAAELRSHIEDCRECGQKLEEARQFVRTLEALKPQSAERRRDKRIKTSDPATIKLIYPNVSDPLAARILDVSRDGLKVEVPQFLDPGTTVQILMDASIVIAEIRYCVRAGAAYHIGVLIQDAFARPKRSH